MNQDQHPQHSQLFTLRMWQEELSESHSEWRGQIRHVTSGETRYFRDWSSVIQFIQAALSDTQKDQDTPDR